MSAPHERINFSLRPNKRIERSMIAEVLLRIARYDNPSRFAYIGMGSFYFSDFVLMHKTLGIDKMISIESDLDNKARFKFNKPLGCVKIVFGTTHEKLPTLTVFDKQPVIAWMDYYGYLDDAKLGDVELIVTKCLPGSALLVTVNAGTPAVKQSKLQDFEEHLSEANRPAGYNRQLLATDESFAELCRKSLNMRLQSAIAARNGGNGDTIAARQVFNFRYRDGQPMATFGWLFPTLEQAAHLDRDPQLLTSAVVSSDWRGVNIDAPVLTFKEIAYLKSLLPETIDPARFLRESKHVPRVAAKKFAELYRYFPSFAHIEE